MTRENELGITGIFDWKIPSVVPSFISGEDARIIYEQMKETFGEGIWYDEASKTMRGSNFPLVARIDSIMRPLGIRVATLANLSRPEIMEMVKGNYYSDTPELVLRTLEDSYEPNNFLIKGLVPHIEEKQGRLQLPVKLSGLDVVVSEDTKGYRWDVIPRDDFTVVHDERLDRKYNGRAFSKADELGLPLFDEHGDRKWYARNQGLSRLYLDMNLLLNSDYGNLANSGEVGRVVLVSGEASALNLSKDLNEKRIIIDRTKLERIYEDLRDILGKL